VSFPQYRQVGVRRECGQCPRQAALDSAARDPGGLSDLLLGEMEVVAQNDGLPLRLGQATKGASQRIRVIDA
jgi:hypothetical protein